MTEECKTFQTLGKPVLIVRFQAHPIIVLWLSVLRSRFCPQESFATICSCLEIKNAISSRLMFLDDTGIFTSFPSRKISLGVPLVLCLMTAITS